MKIRLFALLAITAFISGCTDKDGATNALKKQGYTDISTTGYDFFGSCGKGDAVRTGFIAKSPTGMDTKGVVCAGWFFRGNLIRTYN